MHFILMAALAAASPNAVEAERAYKKYAQQKGQWTAAREYAHPDAVIFTPQAVWARDFLKGKTNPAEPSDWSPNASYRSCDGRLAVNTGPWRSPDARTGGFFTTVWEQNEGKWRWISDGRHTLKKAITARKSPIVRTGSCSGSAPGAPLSSPPTRKLGPGGASPDDYGRGQSGDRTLGWEWRVRPNGVRQFRAYIWNGRGYTVALDQKIGRR